MEPKTICIYHGNCADGFGAAWVVREYFKTEQLKANIGIGEDLNIEFFPGVYQTPPPDVTGKDVIIVDFSYKRAVIEEMLEKANNILIIDHHQSAIDDLSGIDLTLDKYRDLQFYFDVKHSGAMLAWNYFFGEETDPDRVRPPDLLYVIEHRDLWKFSNPPTDYDKVVRQVQANLFSYPYDFDVWDMLMGAPLDDLQSEGEAIERKHFKDINELLGVCQRRGIIGGFDVPIANLPYILSSDAGEAMNKGEPFAACWMETKDGFVFSLRSRFGDPDQPQAVDVSKIAFATGKGGGHPKAAGFKVDRNDTKQLAEIFSNPVILTPDPYSQTK